MIDRRNFLGIIAAAGGWTVLAEPSDASAVVVADAGKRPEDAFQPQPVELVQK